MNKIYLPDHDLSSIASKHFHFIILLLLAFLTMNGSHAQVNAYARVTNINAARTILTISNLNQSHGSFAAGRQVIVLQMQDNVIGNTGNNAGFGSLSNIGSAGLFEMATVQSINGSQMTLTGPLQNNYPTNDNTRVQVVSFNKLGNPDFTTTEDITAVPWNGSTGGVIAFQVAGTLTLRHSIIADEAGFNGGNASDNGQPDCQSSVYITGSNGYGEKGDGIYRNTNGAQSRARGRLLNGGGGGNGFNAGGAGGGNYSGGGDGGPGFFCNSGETGGLGGIALNLYLMTGNRVFMGGGGGGGQGDDGDQTPGGNGGGIIIIKAQNITTAGFGDRRISANGASSQNTIRDGNDGAGGAGAGGTIFLQANEYSATSARHLYIQANGGDGGNVASIFQHGGGGGGGQGAVLFPVAAPADDDITVNTLNGTGGLNYFFFGASRAGNGTGQNNIGIVSGVGIGLPVRLIYFTAEKNNTKTRLNWTATDEENTVFHVQHSTDGTHYTEIGLVHGISKGEAITNYSFTHTVPASGVNFYRLEMKEEPDYIRYSSVASVNFSDLPAAPLAWPNPAHDHFSMRLTDIDNNTRYAVTISDLAGKLLYTSTIKPVNNIITVKTGNTLQPGVYIVRVHTGNNNHFVKLIIQ